MQNRTGLRYMETVKLSSRMLVHVNHTVRWYSEAIPFDHHSYENE